MRFFVALTKWIRKHRGLGASWAVLSRWYAGICKRADRRFDKLMLREAASLTPLDPTWFNDQSAEYSMEFNAARGLTSCRPCPLALGERALEDDDVALEHLLLVRARPQRRGRDLRRGDDPVRPRVQKHRRVWRRTCAAAAFAALEAHPALQCYGLSANTHGCASRWWGVAPGTSRFAPSPQGCQGSCSSVTHGTGRPMGRAGRRQRGGGLGPRAGGGGGGRGGGVRAWARSHHHHDS